MKKQKIQKVYPLTPMQEGMMYHSLLEPTSSFYFTQLELAISGDLDIEILKKSIEELIRNFDILRTVFVHKQLERPRQVVYTERQINVHFENIMELEPDHQQEQLRRYKQENQSRGFDLTSDLLFRVAVFQLADNVYQLIWSNHHILIDGWSLGILMKKLFSYYAALRSGTSLQDETVRPYADYIKWLGKQDREAALEYWQKRLDGFDQSTSLPNQNQVTGNEYRNEEYTFSWNKELVASIKEIAAHYQVTAPNLFQAIWAALLARYNNTSDVVFGTVVSGRPSAVSGIENMAGLFINTIPVRLQIGEKATFADLFRCAQQEALEAEKHDYVPLYEIQNRSSLHHNLISHLLAFENYPLDRELEKGNFEERLGFSAQVAGTFEQTNYDFNLIAFPGDVWTIKMMYNASVFDRQWIERAADHLTNMIQQMVLNPDAQISSVCFLSDDEKQHLLGSGERAEYPGYKTIQNIFEEKALQFPDKQAVVCNGVQITYGELNRKANRLARILRGKGVRPDGIVGIMAERSNDMIVGMLAILKAGGAYLPIDPSYPEDRIRFMLEDSRTRILVTQGHLRNHVTFEGETLDINKIESLEEDDSNLDSINTPDHLSYIIYTSGTTGKPKGVMITHRNVVSLLFNDRMPFFFSEEDTWTFFHSFCFDFSVWEMYGALLYGGKLVVVPKHVTQSPTEFRELLVREQVTVLNQTPTAFSSLIVVEKTAKKKELNLRYVVFGGEALKPIMLKEWHQKYPQTKLINMYGITETTVHVTYKEIGEKEIRGNVSNIGSPLPTLSCYIVDMNLNLVPAGVTGELCVTGLGVARGYLHRPELTNERFIDNPYVPGELMYRSGDLARILPNGEMEYFGRMDHQVKIRGFRIELGEIENEMLKAESITEAAVLARTDHQGDQMLCAYFVADKNVAISGIRESLHSQLPSFMVPTHFLQLPKMPVTSNGKLDRKALILLENVEGTERKQYQEPRNTTEKLLSEIWQDVLGVKQIGIDDDFFALGGHSLKALMISNKISQKLERDISLKTLFERITIRDLSQYLQQLEAETVETIKPAPRQPYYPVSSAQRRMYILSQLEGAGVSYNIPAALILEGELDKEQLETAFQSLIDRHEILRTSFQTIDGKLVQKIHEHVPFQLFTSEDSEENAKELIRTFIRPFNLSNAPLVRAELVQFEKNRHLLLIDMHHIISDGVSSGILILDLARFYRGERLAERDLHYKDFAVWQNSDEQRNRLEQLGSFWLNTFSGEIPILELPTDFPRPGIRSYSGERFGFGISAEIAKRITRLTSETGTTTYMFLLAVFKVFLSKITSQEDIIVGSPTAGRTHSDLGDVPGMFVNTLALRTSPEGDKTFKEFLLEVKETCLKAFEYQDYPFEQLVERLPLERDTTRSPLFNVMFNMKNMENLQLQLGSLKVTPYKDIPVPAKYDLTLEAVEEDGTIGLSFDYATSVLSQETIKRWSSMFQLIAEMAADQPITKISEIEIISKEELQSLIDVSSKQENCQAEKKITGLFMKQVLKIPEQAAVADQHKTLTYRELDDKSTELAKVLLERGIHREDPVALILERSCEMIIAVLAVLKAGGVYVPVDLENPESRTQFILEDSGARFLITDQHYLSHYSKMYNGEIIDILASSNADGTEMPAIHSRDLAYIIYTSGTTGKPKGVMIEHRQVTHLVEGLRRQVYSSYTKTLNVALVAPFHFDASVQQIFASLLLGHTLYVVPKSAVADGRALTNYYRSRAIDITDGTPAHLQMLLAAGTLEGLKLQHMLIGGEALPAVTVDRLSSLFRKHGTLPAITNVYGPTECCVDVSAYDIISKVDEYEFPYFPIGKPLGNNRLYILDKYGHMLPDGVQGELYIAGDGVGRGYLNLPELTAEKFTDNPFIPGERMYRSGDLAKRLPDGNVQFLGRVDFQVKIRGYRIELGEIESVMQRHENITKAVIIANQTGASVDLYSYFTADYELSVQEIREWLAAYLPKYMVPSFFKQLDSIPLTSNGKVNRKALPSHDFGQMETEYAAPESECEKQLCDIWQKTLGMEIVGVNDNFFDLGGHSLKAMTVIGSIQKYMNRDISLNILFEHPTIRKLAFYLKETTACDIQEFTEIKPAHVREFYPVSSAQKRMFILQKMSEEGTGYNMPSALLLEGELDICRLERSLQSLIERHESLRTSFFEMEGVLNQKVHKQVKFQISVIPESEKDLDEAIRTFIRPFDLCQAPLIRAGLYRLSDHRHLLLIDMHHIIADGVSARILINQLAHLYKGSVLPEPKLHYKDFTVWQNELVQQENIRNHGRYWLNQFSENVPNLQLPADYPRPTVQSFAGSHVRFDTAKEMTSLLRKLTSETGTTLHMFLLAVFTIFLAKISSQEEMVVGTAAAGRKHPDLERVPGMFVNTVAIRTEPKAHKTFRQFLVEVKDTSLQALEHQDYPFEELVNQLNLPRDLSRNPLFTVMLSLENREAESVQLGGLSMTPYEMPHAISKFDLTLAAVESEEELSLEFEYSSDLFKHDTIVRWSEYFLNMIRNISVDLDSRLAEIEIISPDEKQKIKEWNSTYMKVPTDKTIHELFEEQVMRTPDHPAVNIKGQKWTYNTLNARANRLAHVLMENGIGPEKRVGIMVRPSLEMAAGVLAILKAGGAFVPIDPSYPEERIAYILADSEAPILLTQTSISVPTSFSGKVILLDGEPSCWGEKNDINIDRNIITFTNPENLAYVIYTSGTTGQPKGVMIEHHSLVNLCYWHNEEFGVSHRDRSAKYAGFGFDASVWELFPYWISGAEVHILEEDIRMDLIRLNDYFEQKRITITFLPTQLAEQFIELENHSLRTLLTGGDKLKRNAACRYTLVNNYGPTESTVVASSTSIRTDDKALSIGRPIANTRIYILGAGNQLQPPGIAGELCIAGRGLARGYNNLPNETAEKFVADPFNPGERMYRTGDMARWNDDGSIEYIGRIDQQVKIRGFRIEIGEIEAHLSRNPLVKEAAVSDVKDMHGNTALCAYVVLHDNTSSNQLQKDLAKTLPDYMVPQFWQTLEALPLTQNGKLNKKALPQPEISVSLADYEKPNTEKDTLLAEIWEEVLGVNVGIRDNFFFLGGDSIKAIQVASRLHKYGWKMDMKDLFQNPTIEKLSSFVRRAEGIKANQGAAEGDVTLTPIQRWFLDQRFTNQHHWNQSFMFHAPAGFEPGPVKQTLAKLMAHHDALRMIFTENEKGVTQFNQGTAQAESHLEIFDLRGQTDLESHISEHANKVQSSINLKQGPLMKTAIFQTDQGDHLLVVIHHLVVDAVSWRILLEDFASGYLQALKGDPVVFQEKSDSFKDWAKDLEDYANSESFLRQSDFWRRIDNTILPALPKDNSVHSRKVKDSSAISFELTEEETRLLLTEVHRSYRTEINDILLCALGLAVKAWTGESKVGIHLEGHGREEMIPGRFISRTVGWFTAQYPVILDMFDDSSIPMVIKNTKESLRSIPQKGVGYGILRYMTDEKHKSDLTFTSDPEISFNYLGQFDKEVKTEYFEPSPFDMGSQMSPESESLYPLNITGLVRSGRMILSCSFNKQEFLKGTVTQFMNKYKHHLLQLIGHCVSKTDTDFTPSDFNAADMEMDEIADLFEVLADKFN